MKPKKEKKKKKKNNMQKPKNHRRPKKTTSGKSRKWSAGVTQHSDALDLEKGVFTKDDPEQIARSLERSAEHSTRKKGSSYQSAMSMLNFYINRAGKNLPEKKKKVLVRAKDLLKEIHQEQQQKEKQQPGKKTARRTR